MYRGIGTFLSLSLTILGVWLTARFALPIAAPFLLGLALSLAAEPLVSVLGRKLGLKRGIASGIGVSLTFCILTILVGILVALLVRELGVLAGILPDMEQTARTGIHLVEEKLLGLTDKTPRSIRPILHRNVQGFFSDGTALLNRAVEYVLGLAGRLLTHVPDSALTLGTGIISAFMISAKLPQLKRWLLRHIPREKLRHALDALGRLKAVAGHWLLAQLKLTGVSAGILLAGLLLLRVPYAPLLALGISLVDAFPVLGTGTVLLPWAAVLFLQGDGGRALGILGIYTVVSVSRSVLEPRFLGRQLGLDPLVTLIALYAGYKLWGVAGMILAPLLTVAAIQLLPQGNR